MRQTIRLTEGELRNIVRNCINEAVNEIGDTYRGQFVLGQLEMRKRRQAQDAFNSGNGIKRWLKGKDLDQQADDIWHYAQGQQSDAASKNYHNAKRNWYGKK